MFALCIANTACAATELHCRSVSFSGQIRAGEKFIKEIGGGLALELTPQEFGSDPSIILSGWSIGLFPASPKSSDEAEQDFIYPVNPPLRFNPWQDIGASYSTTAEQKLRAPIVYDFVLNRPDYRKISARVTSALWPHAAKDADRAADNYFAALSSLQLGQLKFSPLSYVTTQKGMSIAKLEFRVQVSAPSTFPFSNALAPRPSVCPARKT